MNESNMKVTLTEISGSTYKESIILDRSLSEIEYPETGITDMLEAFAGLSDQYTGKRLRDNYHSVAKVYLPAFHTKIVRDTETRLEIQLARHSYTASIETDGRTVKQDWDYRLLGVIEFKQGRIIRVYPLDEISVYKGEAEFPEDEGCTEEEWKNGYWAMDAFLSEGTID